MDERQSVRARSAAEDVLRLERGEHLLGPPGQVRRFAGDIALERLRGQYEQAVQRAEGQRAAIIRQAALARRQDLLQDR